jgi:hypothetical protein
MAKAAIAALTVSIAREMGKYGVRSNFIAPRARTTHDDVDAEPCDVRRARTGLRLMHPAWPAELVVFLASEHIDFNGQGFIVWGGQVVWSAVGTPCGRSQKTARQSRQKSSWQDGTSSSAISRASPVTCKIADKFGARFCVRPHVKPHRRRIASRVALLGAVVRRASSDSASSRERQGRPRAS